MGFCFFRFNFVKEHWQKDEKRVDMGCGNGHCLWSPVGNFIR